MKNKDAIKVGVETGEEYLYEMRMPFDTCLEIACAVAIANHEERTMPDRKALEDLAMHWEMKVTGHYTGPALTEQATMECVNELREFLKKLDTEKL